MEGDSQMKRQLTAILCGATLFSTAIAFLLSSGLAGAQQKSAASREQRQVQSTVKDIMDAMVDPSADVIWGAVGTVVDETGVHESSPKTEEDWANIRRAAIRIIEGGNLLAMPRRDVAPAGTKSETPGVELEPAEIAAIIRNKRTAFDAFARALRGAGVEVLQASEKKDAASLIEIGGRMQDVCENCHQTFWYPPVQQPSSKRGPGRK
jgi:hypothetical protein